MRNLVGIHSDLLQHGTTCGAEDNVDVRNNQVSQKKSVKLNLACCVIERWSIEKWLVNGFITD